MLKELTNSIKAILYERTVSPLSGVFVGFWLVFNWKPLVLLLWWDSDVMTRITYIEALYTDIERNLYGPAICTAIFLLVYPFLAFAPYALWELVSAWKISLKQRFESTVTLPVGKSVELRKEMRDQHKRFMEAMELNDEKIRTLEKDKDAAESELATLKDAFSSRGDTEAQLVKMTERLASTEAQMNDRLRESDAKNELLRAEAARRDSEASRRELELKEQLKAKQDQFNEMQAKFNEMVEKISERTVDLEEALRARPYRLFYNPAVPGQSKSKIMRFGGAGTIIEGANTNESAWRIQSGLLEFVDSAGKVHSRFWYNPRDEKFRHTNDPDTGSIIKHRIKDQYMAPEDLVSS